ncbi:MAG: PHB depolymerase family esterase [Dehalococcoidia bacterium]|nr:hypothetical protein [Dehalococcoidia bacterium]MCB9485605.1 hypothetical protein [Thermoflexaceae bacterium]
MTRRRHRFRAAIVAVGLLLLAAVTFVPLAAAQSGPRLTPRLRVAQLSADQGRITTLPGLGCAGHALTGIDAVRSLASAGRSRSYRVYLPTTSKPGIRLPVVIDFHALASNGQLQESLTGFRALAESEGFILVHPDGVGTPSGWNALLNTTSGIDDVQFTSDLLDDLLRDYCVDARRIYATGFSNGAMLASRIGCQLGSRVAAIAPVAGFYTPDDNCVGVAPVLAIHGTNDDVVPFAGGLTVGVPYPGVEESLKQWAGTVAHCSGAESSYYIGPGLRLESYEGCGRELSSLLIVEGLGHAPPTGAVAEYIWSFFKQQQLPWPTSYAANAPVTPSGLP